MTQIDSDYLIIGNSTAAVGAIEAIRSRDSAGSIAVVASEIEHTYSRPLITYFMSGRVPEDRIYFRPTNFYEKNYVDRFLGVSAIAIRPDKREVQLDNGRVAAYRHLLIAAGGSPIVPRMEGTDRPGVFFMNTVEDARRAKGWISHSHRSVVIGGGLTGLKTAEALIYLGQEVTVVEFADRVLAASMDDEGSKLVRETVSSHGVEVLTGVSVTAINGGDDANDVAAVSLSTGEVLACDSVFVTIGVKPRIDLVDGSGIGVSRGILVDRQMRTNVDGVYAAGDIAEAYDPLSDDNRVIPILPNAYIGGRVAGLNMTGVDADYNVGMSVNSVSFFGEPFMSAGFASQESNEEFTVLRRQDERGYRKIVLKNDRLVGLIVTGDVERAGLMTGLMRAAVPVGDLAGKLLEGGVTLMDMPSEILEERLHGNGRNWQ